MTTTTIEQFREQCLEIVKRYCGTSCRSDVISDIAALPLPVMPSQDAEVMPEQAEPEAWWNKSIGGFYLSEKSIPAYEKASHAIAPLFAQDQSALLARIAELEAENQKLKEDREFDKHVMLQMAGDLGAISHHLGIPDTEGGADPILEKIEELEARITQVKDQFAKYESSANDNDIDMMFEYDELKKLIQG